MRAAIVALAIASAFSVAACYSPAAPSGSYQCDPSGGCPVGLECKFGVCVTDATFEVQSFLFSLDTTVASQKCTAFEADLCVDEDEPFNVTVTAYADPAPNPATSAVSKFNGPASLSASWGHAIVSPSTPFSFVNGVAKLTVTLDRATPGKSSVVLIATTGTVSSASTQTLFVDPPPVVVAQNPTIVAANVNLGGAVRVPWARTLVGLPAIDHASDGFRMYFTGVDNADTKVGMIGLATSPDGNTWTVGSGPVLVPEAGFTYLYPSALRVGPSNLRLFFTRSMTSGMGSSDIYMSSFNGTAYTPPAMTLLASNCSFCNGQITTPWTVQNPAAPNAWLLYFSSLAQNQDNLGVARTADEGANWAVAPLSTPGGDNSGGGVIAPRVLYDPRTGIYRMWYTGVTSAGLLTCTTQIFYATSQDGVFFTASRQRQGRNPIAVADVPWSAASNPLQVLLHANGVYAGAVELAEGATGYRVWIGPMAGALGACAPVSIGQMTRP